MVVQPLENSGAPAHLQLEHRSDGRTAGAAAGGGLDARGRPAARGERSVVMRRYGRARSRWKRCDLDSGRRHLAGDRRDRRDDLRRGSIPSRGGGTVCRRLMRRAGWPRVPSAKAAPFPAADAAFFGLGHPSLIARVIGGIEHCLLDGERPLCQMANDGDVVTTPVGSFVPDSLGRHEMVGNVAEWTRSRYAPYPLPRE